MKGQSFCMHESENGKAIPIDCLSEDLSCFTWACGKAASTFNNDIKT